MKKNPINYINSNTIVYFSSLLNCVTSRLLGYGGNKKYKFYAVFNFSAQSGALSSDIRTHTLYDY